MRQGLQRKSRKPAAGGLAELEQKARFFAALCAAKKAPKKRSYTHNETGK
jgi:hypothetical protein